MQLNDLILALHQILIGYDDAHGVYAGGQMLKGYAEILQSLQHAAAKTKFRIHHRFVYGDQREILVAGNPVMC